jgi:hypothetical protein
MDQFKLKDALENLRISDIRELLKHTPGASTRATRKADLVRYGCEILQKTITLKAIVDSMDPVQLLALAEAVHGDGQYDRQRFQAKHGELPSFSRKRPGSANARYLSDEPGPLKLLMYSCQGRLTVPEPLRGKLQSMLDAPESMVLTPVDPLPEDVDGDSLQVHSAEHVALAEVGIMLRLVQQGKLAVSATTRMPTAASQRIIGEHLVNGDFYPITAPKNKWEQTIGPIRAFAWPLLLQAGKLVKQDGRKLALTRTGLRALGAPPAQVLKDLWQKWQKVKFFDEFRRVEAIKGQKSRGPGMSALEPRRLAIRAALQECPVEGWIETDAFCRFMQAEELDFDVSHNPWKLYICDRQYGSLGYDGYHDWSILQKRYLLALLFEFAATLGLVDLAYLHPADVERDFGHIWGTDDLMFLSRYDGLLYFRLNPLGAWCLGMTDQYEPARHNDGPSLTVMPNLAIHCRAGVPDAQAVLLLDTWAKREADDHWRMDRARTLLALENGLNLDEFVEFLECNDDQPLPEPAERFIKDCRQRAGALKSIGPATLFECRDTATASAIAGHPETAGLCQRVGKRQLAVAVKHEERFRRRLRIIGFGMAGSAE